MPNVTKNAKNPRYSKFLGNRRKFFLTRRASKDGLNLLRSIKEK